MSVIRIDNELFNIHPLLEIELKRLESTIKFQSETNTILEQELVKEKEEVKRLIEVIKGLRDEIKILKAHYSFEQKG
jgi:uncharacterized coiled-coil protein SlyX